MPLAASSPDTTAIYLTEEIRAIERAAQTINPVPPLMERAGAAAAQLAEQILSATGGRILVLAGPGNNGGDAFVVARLLRQGWHRVDVVFHGVVNKLPADARSAFDAFRQSGGDCTADWPESGTFDLIVDGLLGIGLAREVTGDLAQTVARANATAVPILALDVPSGLNADTGATMGVAIRAAHTITFIGLKPGLLTLDGPDLCGTLHLHDLNLPADLFTQANGQVLCDTLVRHALRPRAKNSHKGSFGSVGIVGGASGMAGAPLLSGRTALLLGAGRVYVGLLERSCLAIDVQQLELMLRPAESLLEMSGLTALLIGPGLGQSDEARAILARALGLPLPLVVDADGLNLIADDSSLQDALQKRQPATVITPHPAEAARLLHVSTAHVQSHRVTHALRLAETLRSQVVLKGAGSVCATPSGKWWINTSGNPGMASAGMGDTLAGMIVALLGQRLDAQQAMLLAVNLHGAAADHLVALGSGPIGLTASEVALAARALLNKWVYGAPANP